MFSLGLFTSGVVCNRIVESSISFTSTMKQLCSTDVVPIVQFVAMTRMHIYLYCCTRYLAYCNVERYTVAADRVAFVTVFTAND